MPIIQRPRANLPQTLTAIYSAQAASALRARQGRRFPAGEEERAVLREGAFVRLCVCVCVCVCLIRFSCARVCACGRVRLPCA